MASFWNTTISSVKHKAQTETTDITAAVRKDNNSTSLTRFLTFYLTDCWEQEETEGEQLRRLWGTSCKKTPWGCCCPAWPELQPSALHLFLWALQLCLSALHLFLSALHLFTPFWFFWFWFFLSSTLPLRFFWFWLFLSALHLFLSAPHLFLSVLHP